MRRERRIEESIERKKRREKSSLESRKEYPLKPAGFDTVVVRVI